jgi:uncharacterized membrane protein
MAFQRLSYKEIFESYKKEKVRFDHARFWIILALIFLAASRMTL